MNKIGFLSYVFSHSRNGIIKRRCLKKICQLEGGEAYSKTARALFAEAYGIHVGYGTYGGVWTNGQLYYQNITIGNYCSIAQNIYVYTENHPLDRFSTHPFLYHKAMGAEQEIPLSGSLNIGNDVWIGQNVIILPGCHHIGDGAVIGAGSVVTHNIEPFTINVGNPAKAIRKRFSDETIAKIMQTQWWNMELDELKKHKTELQGLLNDLRDVKGNA